MRKRLTIILLFLISFAVSAQENPSIQVIKGKVIDSSSKNAVAYTNIGLEGTFYGTASDNDGNFELKIPAELQDLQIYFSAVGYKNKKFPVADLFAKEFNLIRMDAQTYNIGDIDINAQSKVLYRILRTASENVSRNFVNQPISMLCSYENEKKQSGEARSRKATVRIDDKTGYAAPSKTDAYKNRNYQFSDVRKNFESYSLKDGATNMDEILGLDLARSLSSVLNPGILSGFHLSMEDEAVINNSAAWVIGFRQPAPTLAGSGNFYATSFEGKIYINKNNYSVLKIECWVKAPKQNNLGRDLAIGAGIKDFYTGVAYDFSVTYNSKGVKFISLNKNYTEGGSAVTEHTQLVVNETKPIMENQITSRDYFEEE